MPLVLIMKDKDEEQNTCSLDNLGLKAFAIDTRDEEVFDTVTESATIGCDNPVGKSFGVCCPGVEIFLQNRQMLFRCH